MDYSSSQRSSSPGNTMSHQGQDVSGINTNQPSGSSSGWKPTPASQDRATTAESQMASLARLASQGVNVQSLLRNDGFGRGTPSYQLSPSGVAPQAHYQRDGHSSSQVFQNKSLPRTINNYTSQQYHPNSGASVVQPQAVVGHVDGTVPCGYGPGVAASMPSQQCFDFEPTPIAEMTHRATQPVGNQQQQQPFHQWFRGHFDSSS